MMGKIREGISFMRLLGYVLVGILSALYTSALYTSAWWALIVFDLGIKDLFFLPLIYFVIFGSLFLLVKGSIYVIDNWEKIWR